MRAKTNTASTCWHTLPCAATFLKESLENPSSLNRQRSPPSSRGSGEEERARKEFKNCFGQVEENLSAKSSSFSGAREPGYINHRRLLMSRKNLAYRGISTMYKRFLAGSLRNRAKSARPPPTFGWLSATYSFDDDPLISSSQVAVCEFRRGSPFIVPMALKPVFVPGLAHQSAPQQRLEGAGR
jgi:hypothetical protein